MQVIKIPRVIISLGARKIRHHILYVTPTVLSKLLRKVRICCGPPAIKYSLLILESKLSFCWFFGLGLSICVVVKKSPVKSKVSTAL